MLKRFLPAVTALMLAMMLVLAGCAKNSSEQATRLTGSGATFPQPLYTQWFAKYYNLTGVRIDYGGGGSGAGIAAIAQGIVNFAGSDALLTPTQLAAVEAAYGKIVTIPMTADAIPVVYNVQGVSSGLKLSGEVLANIYLGTITKWNDPTITALNPDLNLPDASITTIHRSDSSGTTNIFTNYLAKISPAWVSTIGGAGFGTTINWPTVANGSGIGAAGNAGVASALRQNPNSIGYVGLAYAIENNLPCIDLQNATGNFITPSVASTTVAANGFELPDDMRIMITNSAEATAYPIVGFTWLLVYENQTNQAKGQAIVDFLWWAIHDGQADAPGLHFAQLSSAAVAKAETLVKSIKYHGQSIYGS
ncbi:MAG: phosphate ABC transporter substrate-binding protein PstS [Dehalococcoidia bacterium]|nr:phosphate ABC transporter substrate-binding protein PstS [Dehalococcoidia bacterium]